MRAAAWLTDRTQRRNVMLLWAGQGIGQVVMEAAGLVLPIVAVAVLAATPGQVGLVRGAVTLPGLLVTLLVGAWVDRTRRQSLLVGSTALQFAALVILAVLALSGALGVGALVLAGLALGVAAIIFDVAYSSFVPSVVPAAHLSSINSRLFAAQATAAAIGPGVAGGLISAVGTVWTLVVTAVGSLLTGGALAAIDVEEPAVERTGQPVHRGIAAGVSAVLRHPVLRPTIVGSTVYNFWYEAFFTVFLVYALTNLGLSAGMVGAVLASASIGAIVGSGLSERAVEIFGLGRAFVASFGLAALAPLALLPVRQGSAVGVVIIIASFSLSSLGIAVYNVQSVSLRQLVTPSWALGRVSATAWALIFGSLPLGAVAGGALAELLGTRSALAVAVLGMPSGWLVLATSNVRALRVLPTIDERYWAAIR